MGRWDGLDGWIASFMLVIVVVVGVRCCRCCWLLSPGWDGELGMRLDKLGQGR